MTDKTRAKLIHYYLNLDYPRFNTTLENQTNQLINDIINDFVHNFKENFQNKYVVLEIQNDTFSIIAYNILKNIQSVFPFALVLYGKRKNVLKKYFKTHGKSKEKFISKRTLLKLKNLDKVIYVSCYHSLYNVMNKRKTFNFLNDSYQIIKNFTPEELKMTKIFYGIKQLKKDNIYFKSELSDKFNDFCNGELSNASLFNFPMITEKIPPIAIVKLTGDNAVDNDLLNSALDTNGMIFYYCEKLYEKYSILNSPYQYFLKNKSNIPNLKYYNINEYNITKELSKIISEDIIFIGDFSEKEKKMWR